MEGSFAYVPNKKNMNGFRATPKNDHFCCDSRKRYNFVKQSCKCCCFCIYYPLANLNNCTCFNCCVNCVYELVLEFLKDINNNIVCCKHDSHQKQRHK